MSELDKMIIHPPWKAQIAILQWDKAFTNISKEYFDYTDIFFLILAYEFLENTIINKVATKLVNDKQPLYRSIYALSLLELEVLKAYIKTYLETRFIWLSESLLMPLSYCIKHLVECFVYVSIIKKWIISPSNTGIFLCWLKDF